VADDLVAVGSPSVLAGKGARYSAGAHANFRPFHVALAPLFPYATAFAIGPGSRKAGKVRMARQSRQPA